MKKQEIQRNITKIIYPQLVLGEFPAAGESRHRQGYESSEERSLNGSRILIYSVAQLDLRWKHVESDQCNASYRRSFFRYSREKTTAEESHHQRRRHARVRCTNGGGREGSINWHLTF